MNRPEIAPSLPASARLNRWLLGTAALGAAGTASAEVVQITLSGNEISANGSILTDNTNDDVTGDGIGDLGTSSSFFFNPSGEAGIAGRIAGERVRARASTSSTTSSTFTTYSAWVGSASNTGGSPQTTRGLIPIRFTDARINGGATTEGLLEVLAENLSFEEHRIEIVRVIFDDEDTNRPEGLLSTVYPEWADSAALTTPVPTTSAPGKIERKIAALERKIRQIKANSPQNAPRLNFYKLQAARLRQIATYERQIAALKRKLAKGGR